MWTTEELGLASWQVEGPTWSLDARGGERGIALTCDSQCLSFESVDQDQLPVAGEQYVRGNRWHVNYPQIDGSFAMRMAFVPIHTTRDRMVIEACVSIQTDLLDSNPKIDIEVACDDIESWVPESDGNEVGGTGCAPISLAKSKHHSVAVLLGPHDSPFTTNHSIGGLLRLRLFGEFLEKGVIRRARPWIVIDRGERVPTSTDLTELFVQLGQSPLPLT